VGLARFIVWLFLLSPFLISDPYVYRADEKPVTQVEIYLDGTLWCEDEAAALVTSDTTAQILMDLGPRAAEIADGWHSFKARWANENGWSPMSRELKFEKGRPEKVEGVGLE